MTLTALAAVFGVGASTVFYALSGNTSRKYGKRPTIDELRDRFLYDPEAGALFIAGTGLLAAMRQRNGYPLVVVRGYALFAHRIAWALTHGSWPAHDLDHVNRDRADFRLSNLREASLAENATNKRTARPQSGFKGVRHNGKSGWRAKVTYRGEHHNLLGFETAEEAARAYDRLALQIHGEFACTNAMLGLLPNEGKTT